jgi:16S rRNA (guanine966-N2)-methyltransferase
MRIIAGTWRGRALAAPAGVVTRPTADRVRQSLFDMLMHAPWAGRAVLEGAVVLDAFAGSGALGLEALSRGARHAVFFERDRAALVALRANIAACGAGDRAELLAQDVLRPPRRVGVAAALAFFDPPYGQALVQRSVNVLEAEEWLAPDCLLVAEVGRNESLVTIVPPDRVLAHRVHGAAQLVIWRA